MKEIIIDDVDVAGCRNYKHNAENIGWSKCLSKDEEHYHYNNPLCCEIKDCYYKQLKRAEIEIEKLKGVGGSVHPDSAYYKITRLEQENAELKKEIRQKKMTILMNNDHYLTVEENNRKYKQTLQEIKECLKDWEKAYMSFGFCEYDNILEKIKALITKAEVGE